MRLVLKRREIPAHLIKYFRPIGHKPKDLINIPHMVAEALREDGWFLRQDICWSKPNPMPESVRDRCTKAHEYLFLLSKSGRYYYDAEAIKEPLSEVSLSQIDNYKRLGESGIELGGLDSSRNDTGGRLDQKGRGARGAAMANLTGCNKRSVWEIATAPYSEAHFATFPPALVEPCIMAGCPEKCCAKCGAPWVREVEVGEPSGRRDNGATDGYVDFGMSSGRAGSRERRTLGFVPSCSCNWEYTAAKGIVLDPFGGAGTVGLVADRLQRKAVLIELNPQYAAMAEKRIRGDAPLFVTTSVAERPVPAKQEAML